MFIYTSRDQRSKWRPSQGLQSGVSSSLLTGGDQLLLLTTPKTLKLIKVHIIHLASHLALINAHSSVYFMSSIIICLQYKSVLLDAQSPDLPADQARRSRKGDTIASDLEQATGIEREEIEAFMAGEEASPLLRTLQIHVPGAYPLDSNYY